MIVYMLCRWMIRRSQKVIGLTPRKIAPNTRGVVTGRELLAQPWSYEIFRARNYDFGVKRSRGLHVVIARGAYKVITYSPDPREPTTAHSFASMANAAAHCAKAQMTVAISSAMQKDGRGTPPKPGSYEELKQWAYSLTDYKAKLEARLDSLQDRPTIRAASFLIDRLA